MTTTIPEPGKKTNEAAARAEFRRKAERGSQIAAKLLAAHDHKPNRKPITAMAFGRALAVTSPSSEHGQLLAAALRPTIWQDRPEAERIVLQLARRGQTPTEAAVSSVLADARQHKERDQRLRHAAAAYVDRDGPRAATHIAGVVSETAAGPTWVELRSAMGWPDKPYGLADAIIRGLARAGWLEFTTQHRSLRPSRLARDLAEASR